MTKAIICPHCGGENFGTKIKCHHCGKILADIPIEIGDKSPGRAVSQLPGKMKAAELRVETGGELVSDVTEAVKRFALVVGQSGLVHLFVPHATAGIALMETGSGSESDLDQVLARLAPADNRYTHHHGSKGHGRDHVIPVFISPSISIPMDEGKLVLGQWQSIVLVDSNRDNAERRVRMSFIPGQVQEGQG